MSIFSLCIMASTGLGSFMGGFIEQYPSLQWRWIQWISLMYVLCFVWDDTAARRAFQPCWCSISCNPYLHERNKIDCITNENSQENAQRDGRSEISCPCWGRVTQSSHINLDNLNKASLYVSSFDSLFHLFLNYLHPSIDLLLTEPIVISFSVRPFMISSGDK